MTSSRPNILFLCSDQERNRVDLPATLNLPNQDRLCAKGTYFNNFHVTTSPCTPSRSVIYSGRHSESTGVVGNTDGPPFRELPEHMSIGRYLRDAGYYTAYKGKWHLSNLAPLSDAMLSIDSHEQALEAYGFSDYTVDGDSPGYSWEGYCRDRAIASDAANWLHRKGRSIADVGQPWFLAVNFFNPHDVMFYEASPDQPANRPHPNLLGPLKPDPQDAPYSKFWDLPLPASFDDDLSKKPWAQANHGRIWEFVLGGPDKTDTEAWRRLQSYYLNCIEDMDTQLGTVLDALEASGQAENTVIVYTSDHGEMGGAHGLREKGPMIYRENLRVPLIICDPDVAGGRETDSLASSVDIVPTLLRRAGVTVANTPPFPGIDLSDALTGTGSKTARDEAGILFYYSVMLLGFDSDKVRQFFEGVLQGVKPPPPPKDGPGQPIDDRVMIRGIHDGRYKFARYFAAAEHHVPIDLETLTAHNDLELYDLETDPNEMNNLANDPAASEPLILALNEKLNRLIAAEVGTDDGREFPGDSSHYQLKA